MAHFTLFYFCFAISLLMFVWFLRFAFCFYFTRAWNQIQNVSSNPKPDNYDTVLVVIAASIRLNIEEYLYDFEEGIGHLSMPHGALRSLRGHDCDSKWQTQSVLSDSLVFR